MHDLLIQGISKSLMRSLRELAASNGRSAEQEAFAIIKDVVHGPASKAFGEALMSMPNVGLDSDFERHNC